MAFCLQKVISSSHVLLQWWPYTENMDLSNFHFSATHTVFTQTTANITLRVVCRTYIPYSVATAHILLFFLHTNFVSCLLQLSGLLAVYASCRSRTLVFVPLHASLYNLCTPVFLSGLHNSLVCTAHTEISVCFIFLSAFSRIHSMQTCKSIYALFVLPTLTIF